MIIIIEEVVNLKGVLDMEGVGRGKRGRNDVNTLLICDIVK